MQEIYPELKRIENELKEIKLLIMESQAQDQQLIKEKIDKKPVKLKGLLKEEKFEENEIEEAKKAVFKHIFDSV